MPNTTIILMTIIITIIIITILGFIPDDLPYGMKVAFI